MIEAAVVELMHDCIQQWYSSQLKYMIIDWNYFEYGVQ
jgi:hypothetical protein